MNAAASAFIEVAASFHAATVIVPESFVVAVDAVGAALLLELLDEQPPDTAANDKINALESAMLKNLFLRLENIIRPSSFQILYYWTLIVVQEQQNKFSQ